MANKKSKAQKLAYRAQVKARKLKKKALIKELVLKSFADMTPEPQWRIDEREAAEAKKKSYEDYLKNWEMEIAILQKRKTERHKLLFRDFTNNTKEMAHGSI